MKALAGFIVRGRGQAILVASLGGVVAFLAPPFSSFAHYIGAAVVALVTLHISAQQGLVVLALATAVTVLFYQLAGLPAVALARPDHLARAAGCGVTARLVRPPLAPAREHVRTTSSAGTMPAEHCLPAQKPVTVTSFFGPLRSAGRITAGRTGTSGAYT